MDLQIDYGLIEQVSEQFEQVVAQCGNQRDVVCLLHEHHDSLVRFFQWAISRLYGAIYGQRFQEAIESLGHFATLKYAPRKPRGIRVVLQTPHRIGSQMIGRQGMAVRLVAQVLEMVTQHSPIFLDVLQTPQSRKGRRIAQQSMHAL